MSSITKASKVSRSRSKVSKKTSKPAASKGKTPYNPSQASFKAKNAKCLTQNIADAKGVRDEVRMSREAFDKKEAEIAKKEAAQEQDRTSGLIAGLTDWATNGVEKRAEEREKAKAGRLAEQQALESQISDAGHSARAFKAARCATKAFDSSFTRPDPVKSPHAFQSFDASRTHHQISSVLLP